MATSSDLRDEFPALSAAPDVAYFDSATTTLKPAAVIAAVSEYLSHETGSVGRGTHPWSARVTAAVAGTREATARFVGALSPHEIAFTAGATASLGAVALSWGLPNLRTGDEILFCPLDHASNVDPWVNLQRLLRGFGVRITLVPYARTGSGEIDTEDLLSRVTARTRLVTATHIHNVFGSLSTLEELDGRLDPAILRCLDCSQSVGHVPVDVGRLAADFVAFSAHKMFGAPGTGVLYCAPRVHGQLSPVLPGSNGVSDRGPTGGAAPPDLFEGGTPNVAGILGLGAAIDFIQQVGVEQVAGHVHRLTRLLVQRLSAVPRLEFLPGVAHASCDVGYGIVSFRIDGLAAADIGFALSSHGFYARTGSHCLPGGVADDSVRLSLHLYNTDDEVDRVGDFLELLASGAI
jgi:cysteine desulfurase/selenocysteine lyase